MTQSQPQSATGPNSAYPWDEFDAEGYFKHNYLKLRADDCRILKIVRNYFARTFAANPLPSTARGIDVGTGTNLYPALTMLPFCEKITLYEFSTTNVKWLMEQGHGNWPSWNQAWNRYWKKLRLRKPYRRLPDPRTTLSSRIDVREGDIFTLPNHEPTQRWDIGTMFFVAESITGQRSEFLSAVDKFFAVLNHGAPFAMAFMEHSKGYHVGGQQYPATDIDKQGIAECPSTRTFDVAIRCVKSWGRPLRDGYSGMVVAHGRVNHANNTAEEID